MEKPFTQITFDFSSTEEVKEGKVNAVTGEEKLPADNDITNTVINDKTDPVIEINDHVELSVKNTNPLKARGRRPLKNNNADELQIPPDEILFQKRYYPIGEVAGMFRVNQSLLRYWETEFDILQPKKNGKGDRFFRAEDVKYLQLIYDLLRRRKFTIEGAKTFLKNNKGLDEQFDMIRSLEQIKAFLLELKASL